MTFSEEIRKRIKPFLLHYIDFEKDACVKGILTSAAIRQSFKALIDEEIFTIEELRNYLLIEAHILISTNMIEECI